MWKYRLEKEEETKLENYVIAFLEGYHSDKFMDKLEIIEFTERMLYYFKRNLNANKGYRYKSDVYVLPMSTEDMIRLLGTDTPVLEIKQKDMRIVLISAIKAHCRYAALISEDESGLLNPTHYESIRPELIGNLSLIEYKITSKKIYKIMPKFIQDSIIRRARVKVFDEIPPVISTF